IHVVSWAKRFLFRPEQLETPVARLSGGERARIVLARLMLQPADLLVLDEPTNDLDIPTLEVLEESLLEFPGALVLVTHDRNLIDRVSTTILALDGRGGVDRFADYAQWESRPTASVASPVSPKAPVAPSTPAKKLSYLDQRAWNSMEENVLAAEARLQDARALVEEPSIATDASMLERRLAELEVAQREVDRLYAHWAELEQKRK
ncbi:MAG TPA: ATP-binding cassette domain-containing protein, partial [Candidatus Polarisedimenticolaceae bacterium]|nr:ATP-binding cassette domain-containing protein [Candidatus Polarisedimenticolaceae bacterium]